MPDPLPGAVVQTALAAGLGVLPIAAVWDVQGGSILGVVGVPVPVRGSIMYGFAVSFGYVLQSGFLLVNRGRKRRTRSARGFEDGTGRSA